MAVMADREWTHSAKRLRTLAGRVLERGGSPLPAEERAALYARLSGKPVYLLGSTTGIARRFIQVAARLFDVRGVVDDVSRESTIQGIPRLDGGSFVARGAGAVAVCLAFSHPALEYFEHLCRAAGAELVQYMEAVDAIPDYPRDHILASLARTTAENIELLLAASERWADSISRHTYFALLNGRLTYDRTWLESVDVGPETMYFGVDCMELGPHEALVDCGAFDGDTIESFRAKTLDQFESIVGLEPDPRNFAILNQRYGGDPRIKLHSVAASSEACELSFAAGLGAQSFSSAADGAQAQEKIVVAAVDLDTLLECRPTVIKIDVEGGEPEVLEGARRTIEECRPRLTIAAYHRPLHLAEFPGWILSVAPGYRFYLRHHGGFFFETVLYGIPAG
jgi:FkbM family methyltransferase